MKMSEHDWSGVKHFSPNERWGDHRQMDRELILFLDLLRGLFQVPFIIHCGYETRGHTEKSQHYVGKAADFHVEGIHFRDAVDLMVGFIGPPPRGLGVAQRIGLGIYPHWANPGFHLDMRGVSARWGTITQMGRQIYVSWDEAYRAIR